MSCSVTVDSMKVAQILFPKAPGLGIPAPDRGAGGDRAPPRAVPSPSRADHPVKVTNWAKTQTFATASGGSFTHMGGLIQVMAADPIVHQPLEEEMKYLVSFTIDGETKTFGLIFNGTLPDQTLWFVSQ